MAEGPPGAGVVTVGVTTGVVVLETPPPLEVVLLLLVVEDGGGGTDELVVVVCCWLPGRHWEYQSLILLQDEPDWQQVAPVQPLPPHWVLTTSSVEQCP